ncbi:MAG: TonB-dependent receptor, partial [Steroidobacteraceae bacterium]
MTSTKRSTGRGNRVLVNTLVASAVCAALHRPALADESPADSGIQLQEVIVTAEKRSEDVQTVPIAVQVLGSGTLDQMNVKSLDDYIKLLPNVTYGQSTGSPGRANIFMRGITSGLNLPNLESPLVGFYIDEVPTTTAGGQIDFHMYDVARVEALAGPQGTLYGASSEAGTLRIITNKPSTSGFGAGYDVDANDTRDGAPGDVVEGFVNLPLNHAAAIRLVGYQEHDGGYIDNVPYSITYPSTGYTVNNASLVKNDFNSVDTYGGRAALQVDLDEEWTALASVMAQEQRTEGFFGYANYIGVDKAGFHLPEGSRDYYWAPSLTITGKIANFDVTYTGSLLEHVAEQLQDYTDYSYFYDQYYQFGSKYTYGPGGAAIDIGQTASQQYWYRKISQEARFDSPRDLRFRVSGGVFAEEQDRKNFYAQIVAGDVNPSLIVPGFPNVIWLARNKTVDRDYAVFTTLSYDLSSRLTVDLGGRGYRYTKKFRQFTGGGGNPSDFQYPFGVASCIDNTPYLGAPCTDIDQSLGQSGGVYKGSVTFKIAPGRLVYFTASDGYRPGGFNENTGGAEPYTTETLQNYEVGWKTSWLGNTLRWNGDVFYDPWNNFQFSFQGANGNQVTANAGAALSKGIESDLSWRAGEHLSISGAIALIDAKLTENYCGVLLASGQAETNCPSPQAPEGTKLPLSPSVKGNVTARYTFKLGSLDAYFQEATMYTGSNWNYLLTDVSGTDDRAMIGANPAFVQEDLAAGAGRGNFNLELYVKNVTNANGQLDRYVKCNVQLCGSHVYTVNIRPMMVGLKFSQD